MVYVSTHAGKQHCISEDTVLVGSDILTDTSAIFPMPDQGFICIADGVGGNCGGAQASQFILAALPNWKDSDGDLKSFLVSVNDSLIATAREIRTAPNMATTLTGICVSNGNYKLIHIGNTRAYVKQGKYLKQITSDHTTFNWLMSKGQVEAAESSNKSEITNCFGGGNPALLSKLFIADCQQFSMAVLTSDGIHDYVDVDTMEKVITGKSLLSDKCEQIIQMAVDAGSEDDLSVVIICPAEE